MVRRTPRRRLRLLAWLAALLLALAGCAVPQLAPGTLADHLNAALRERSQPAFLDNFTADASGSALGATWYSVLSRAQGSFTSLDATTLEASATMPGDWRAARWTLRLELDGTSPFSTGRIRGVEPAPERPIWALGPVDVTTAEHGTLLSSGLDEAARRTWAERLDRAARIVARTAPAGDDGWPGGLVVDLPASAGDFQAVTGEPASTASALATCATGTPRVVVNPQVLAAPEEWLDSTMVHEAVHVATDSPCARLGDALGWAVEGLAESVSARNDPTTASDNRALVLAYLDDHPVPKALPSQLDDQTSYALAQLAVDELVRHLGPKADDLLARAVRHAGSVTAEEVRRVTRWYTVKLNALRRTPVTR